MCQFLSAIVTVHGKVLCNPLTDSHEDLIELFNVHERAGTAQSQNFARVEFTPPFKDVKPDHFDFDNYTLKLDEQAKPEWYTSEVEESTRKALRTVLNRMLVTTERKVISGGAHLFGEGAKVGKLLGGGRVVAVHPKANLTRANLTGANLACADLTCADLTGADLYCANLYCANLTGANLTCANLTRADLTRANLTCTDLTGANLFCAWYDGPPLADWTRRADGTLERATPAR